MSELIYSWNFSDEKNRGTLWYIITFSIVIGLTIWGILTKQYGMSFLVLLLSGLIYFLENNSPENIEVKVTSLGITIGDYFYDYPKIKNFSFIYLGDQAQFIRLNLNKKGIKKIDLKVNNQICEELKLILSDFIEESDKGELTFSEKLINILKL